MNSQQLQRYLKNVLDLEVQLKTAQDSKSTCQCRLNQLGIDRVPQKPVYQEPPKPEKTGSLFYLFWLAVIGVAGGIWYWSAVAEPDGIILVLLWSILHYLHLGIGLFVVTVVTFLIFSINSIRVNAENRKIDKENLAIAKNNYEKAMYRYNAAVAQNKARLGQEQKLSSELKDDIQLLDQRQKKTQELLEQYYALDVVRPKYRNLLCIATFLEYLENERCYALTGHEGCYNLFEEEAQRGLIIRQLTNISQQLNQIRKTQEYVADALDEISQNTHRLCECTQEINGKLDVIEQNQRVQSYYAQQTANDQRALKDYVMMRDWLHS